MNTTITTKMAVYNGNVRTVGICKINGRLAAWIHNAPHSLINFVDTTGTSPVVSSFSTGLSVRNGDVSKISHRLQEVTQEDLALLK
jgi:hypothetical protein